MADSLLLVEGGRVEGPGDPAELAERLASPPALIELARSLAWRPIPISVEAALAGGFAARAGTPGTGLAGARPIHRPTGRPAFEVRDLAVGAAREPIASGISFSASEGEVVAVVGANGSGKTTLLRTIAGLLVPISGTVTRATDRVAYVPQNPAALLHLPTLRAEVELTARRLGVPDSPAALLEPFGLAALADRYPRDLSSGERQRGALAATLAGRPRLALLDEPTRGMDLRARRSLGAAIRRMRDDGVCVVLATHDVDLAAEVADRAVALEDGRLAELGAPEVAFGAGSNWATQIGRLLPGGPVTVETALAVLGRDGSSAGASPAAGAASLAATRVAPADTRR
jgi:energy-coupling factor transport system ATP-binding protein